MLYQPILVYINGLAYSEVPRIAKLRFRIGFQVLIGQSIELLYVNYVMRDPVREKKASSQWSLFRVLKGILPVWFF